MPATSKKKTLKARKLAPKSKKAPARPEKILTVAELKVKAKKLGLVGFTKHKKSILKGLVTRAANKLAKEKAERARLRAKQAKKKKPVKPKQVKKTTVPKPSPSQKKIAKLKNQLAEKQKIINEYEKLKRAAKRRRQKELGQKKKVPLHPVEKKLKEEVKQELEAHPEPSPSQQEIARLKEENKKYADWIDQNKPMITGIDGETICAYPSLARRDEDALEWYQRIDRHPQFSQAWMDEIIKIREESGFQYSENELWTLAMSPGLSK